MKRPAGRSSEFRNPPSDVPESAGRLLGGILLFFLTLAVALRPLLPGHHDEANLWVAMCVLIAALAWLVRMAVARRVRLARTGLGLPAAALLALAAVSTLRSPHAIESLATLLEWLSYAVVFFVLVNATADGGLDRRFVLRLVWASAFAVCLYGLFQQAVNMPLLQAQIEADRARVLTELRMSERHIGDLMARAMGRIFSTFLVSNSFAGFLALVTPGFVGYVLDRLRAGDRGKVFLGASALWLAAALACLVLTFSKGGWIAFAVGAAAFCLMLGRNLLRRHARLVAGVAAGAAAAFILLLVVRAVPVQIFRDIATSSDVRTGYWRGALGMAGDHPLGGVGLGTFGVHFPRYRPPSGHPVQDAHNDYLQVLAELGVPGLAAFVWLWAVCLRNAFSRGAPAAPGRERRSGGRFPARTAYAAGAVAFVLTTVVMSTFSLAGWWDTDLELKAWLDRGLAVGFALAWVLFFAALGRGERGAPGELCRKGLVCGVIAFLFHCAVDFDYQEPGVAFTAWVVAALCVRPRGAAFERSLRPAAAIAVAACGVVAMACFQFVLLRANGAATDRMIAANLVSDAVRTPLPQRRAELIHKARQHYEAALRANPLDDSLRLEYAELLTGLLVPPDPSGQPHAMAGVLRVLIESPDDVRLFQRAAALYGEAAALNSPWASPHVRLARLCYAAARPDAGRGAAGALRPLVEAARARRAPTGPSLLYLPAVAECEAALERDPNNPSILVFAAEALEQHGDPAAAATARRAIALNDLLYARDNAHKMCLREEELRRAHALLKRHGQGGTTP